MHGDEKLSESIRTKMCADLDLASFFWEKEGFLHKISMRETFSDSSS